MTEKFVGFLWKIGNNLLSLEFDALSSWMLLEQVELSLTLSLRLSSPELRSLRMLLMAEETSGRSETVEVDIIEVTPGSETGTFNSIAWS